jgi:hypothetical protein
VDPISLLLSLLSFAASATKPLENQALNDGYTGLKSLIVRRFGSKPQKAPPAGPTPCGEVVGRINAEHGRVVVVGRDQTGTINMG